MQAEAPSLYAPQHVEPFDGEALFSVVGRWLRVAGHESPRSLVAALNGSPHRTVSTTLPVRLGAMLNVFPPLAGYSLDDAVQAFSIGPLYRPFMGEHTWHQFVRSLRENEPWRARMLLGLVRGGGGRVTLMHCSECMVEQARTHGTLFWKLSHLLPFVRACPEHRELLQPTRPVTNIWLGKHRYLGSPELLLDGGRVREPSQAVVKLSEVIVDLHRARLPGISHDLLARAYRLGLEEAGLVETGGRVRRLLFWSKIRADWAGLQWIRCSTGRTYPAWLASLYTHGAAQVRLPIQHAVVIASLFGSVQQWCYVVDRARHAQQREEHERGGYRQVAGTRRVMLRYWFERGQSVDSSTVEVPPDVAQLLACGLSVRQVSRLTGRSRRFIYGLLQQAPELTRQWCLAAVDVENSEREDRVRELLAAGVLVSRGPSGDEMRRHKKWLARHRHTMRTSGIRTAAEDCRR